MTTIRPNLLPPGGHGPQAQPQDAGKLSAQRAFFEAALRQAGGPAATAAPAAAAPAAEPAFRAGAVSPQDAPQKVLRPGSLIDIRV